MGIYDGGFTTTVPDLNGAVRLVNANGNLLATARNNLLGNVVGTQDSTLNRWEQGVRKLNTQQLTNQYNALTPEQLRAYELQGIDPRQAIADRAGFIYDDFDTDLETARSGAETRLSDYNDRWLQNQYDLLSKDEQYNAYRDGIDPITKMTKDNNIRYYDRAKADTLYDKTVLAGQTEIQDRLREGLEKANLDTRKKFYNGDLEAVVPGIQLKPKDRESAKVMGKDYALKILTEPFKRALLDAHEAGEDITSESVRNNILDMLKLEYGLENSGINSSNIKINFDPNTKDFVEKQEINTEFNNKTNEKNAIKALASDKHLEEELTKDFDKIDYSDLYTYYEDIIRKKFPNASEEDIARIIAQDRGMKEHLKKIMYKFKNEPSIGRLLKDISDTRLTDVNSAKGQLGLVVQEILKRNPSLNAQMKMALQQTVAEEVGLADQLRSTYQDIKSTDELSSAINALTGMYSTSSMAEPVYDFTEEVKDKGAYTAKGINETKLKTIKETLERKIANELKYTQSLEGSTINFIVDHLIGINALTQESLNSKNPQDLIDELKNYNLGANGILTRNTIVQLNKASKAARKAKEKQREKTMKNLESN